MPLDSAASRRAGRCKRRTITHARLAAEYVQKGGFRGRWVMVTPTYAPDVDWHAGHITGLVKCARQWMTRKGHRLHYQWVLELTKKGRPHYHMLIWVPRGVFLPKADTRGWWPHGLTKTETARNPVGYLAKYASKGCADCYNPDTLELNRVPRRARICGGGGLRGECLAEFRWWMTPRWFREAHPAVEDVTRARGGYVVRSTGEFVASPWRFIGYGAGMGSLLFEWVGGDRDAA